MKLVQVSLQPYYAKGSTLFEFKPIVYGYFKMECKVSEIFIRPSPVLYLLSLVLQTHERCTTATTHSKRILLENLPCTDQYTYPGGLISIFCEI